MILAPFLFIMTLISVLATGILMLLVLTKRNRLQITLAGILGVCLILLLIGLIGIAHFPDRNAAVLSSPLRFRFLALGLIAFLATLTYYMVAAHRNMLTIRNGVLFLSPVLLTLVVYAMWHWRMGLPMDYNYPSLKAVWENRFTVPVILRVLMYLFFLIYQGVVFRNMWHLDSMRNQRSMLNSPDAVSNIRWLRMVVVGMMAITVSYSLMIFVPSLWILIFHTLVMVSVFGYFIYNALARPMYEDTEGWQAVWTPLDDWKIINGTAIPPKTVAPTQDPYYLSLIEEWMREEKPFCKTEFSIADIHARFPDLDHETLTDILHRQDANPQAYIRRHRIEEACRMIRQGEATKVSVLASGVGFSHASSFCRAFVAVKNETVGQYMTEVKQNQ